MAAGSWLNDETFDFDLNLSRSSTEDGVLNNTADDDDEVFIGPLTHKEKCMAVIVQEKEAMKSVERLNPSEQALLLREAALVNLRIKDRGTPGRRKMSPVAVVRPMRTEFKENEIIFPITIPEENKENIPVDDVNTTTSSVLSDSPKCMKRSLRKGRLSMPVKPMSQKGALKFAEPLPLETPSTNESKGAGGASTKPLPIGTGSANGSKASGSSTKVEQQKLRRYSSIPKQGSVPKLGIPKSKSDASMPSISSSLLPNSKVAKSSLVKPRMKSKLSFLSQSGNSQPQNILPMKPPPGAAQPELLLSGKSSSTSNDTPASRKKPQMRSSQKRVSLGGERLQSSIGTPAKNTQTSKPVGKSALKLGDHVTPVIKSARRSIVGRQLNSDIAEASRSPSPVDKGGIMSCEVQKQNSGEIEEKLDDVQPPEMIEDLSPRSEENEEVPISIKSEDIPSQSVEKAEVNLPAPTETEEKRCKKTNSENIVMTESKCETIAENIENAPVTPLLIDIFDPVDSKKDSTTPPKLNNADPFETGNTPPPLIDLGEILQPVREEFNLIEF